LTNENDNLIDPKTNPTTKGLDDSSHVDVIEIECPFGDCPITVFQAKGRLRISCVNISYKENIRCAKIDGICRLNLCFEEFGYIPILPP
jgi:uridylate kinase